MAGDNHRRWNSLDLLLAMQELKDAREAFDLLIVGDTDR
jgi:hypothetical protein